MLTFIDFTGRSNSSRARYALYRCDCGGTIETLTYSVKAGKTTRCKACATASKVGKQNSLRHGHALAGNQTPTYTSWKAMHRRCSNPNTNRYEQYGGRGIKVCARWHLFENFLADMGAKPAKGWGIDRINSDGDYEPGNCRWMAAGENARRAQLERAKRKH